MSLKIKIATRLRAKFPGVSLSKKSVEAVADKLATLLTDESTDDEIDAKLDERNTHWSFEDQKKYDDYQTAKEAREAERKAGKKPTEEGKVDPPAEDPNESTQDKLLKQLIEQNKLLFGEIASIKGEKVTNTRKEQLAAKLENAPDAFKNKILKDFGRMKFETDDEFNDYLSETETDAADFVQEQSNAGLGVDRPTVPVVGLKAAEKEVSPLMKNYLETQAAKEKATA